MYREVYVSSEQLKDFYSYRLSLSALIGVSVDEAKGSKNKQISIGIPDNDDDNEYDLIS